jgi:hypothetical protein
MSISKEADNIYLNIIIPGNNANYNKNGPGIPNPTVPSIGEDVLPAYFKTTKTAPILYNPEDYYCSIVRFVVPLASIPITIVPIVPNTYINPGSPGNPNLTTLIIGFSFAGNNYSRYVEYINVNPGLNPPIQNQPVQVVTEYYYVYSYQQILDSINKTLILLWVDAGLNVAFPTLTPPFFSYDFALELINVVVPNNMVSLTTPPVVMYMNNSTLNYLDGFPSLFYGFNQPYGKDYVFQFFQNAENAYPTPFSPGTLQYKFVQEYNTLFFWSTLRKLFFTSTTLPVVNEITQSNTGEGVYTSFPILTDFALDSDSVGSSRSVAIYNPQGQYRLVSLSGNTPISSVDVRIFWSDSNGNIYPLTLPQDQSASIKIGFFKKSLYNNKV